MYDKREFEHGDRVKVLKHKSYRRLSLTGLIGTVCSNYYGGNIGVKLDTRTNDMSMYGYFYFKPSEITFIDENENNIVEETNMSYISNYVNVVRVKFSGDADPCRYVYANFDAGLKVGDTCVVKSANHPFEVATVVEILDGCDFKTDREIVAIVDMGFYNKRVETRVKAAELKAKMQERAKKLQDIALYQMLSEKDSEMAELLNSYNSLPCF